jgi:hypothetical protein
VLIDRLTEAQLRYAEVAVIQARANERQAIANEEQARAARLREENIAQLTHALAPHAASRDEGAAVSGNA